MVFRCDVSFKKNKIKIPDLSLPPCTFEWYHWIGLEIDINRYWFLFLNFTLEYLKRLQSFELLHAKMNPTSCQFGSRFA
jgi:hypothetical protein